MSNIKLVHSGGNSVSLTTPTSNPSSNVTFKLPAADGSAGQILQTDGNGNLSFVDKPTPGITMADQWRINSNYTYPGSGTIYDITANWERNDSTGFAQIGTGMSESSGIFTFPQTGIYWVQLLATTYGSGGDTTAITVQIQTRKSSGSYAIRAQGSDQAYTTNAYGCINIDILFDVEDVSADNLKMTAQSTGSGRMLLASTTVQRTGFTFIRLGDT